MRVLRREEKAPIWAFGDISKKLNLANRVYRGLQVVPVVKIVGSVGRAKDLLPGFRMRNPDARYYRVRRAMERGEILPPIIVYKVGDEYYVLDGNHRVAVAKELGIEFLDAEVIEFFPSERRESRTLRAKRIEFENLTGLRGIDAGEPRHYDVFLNYIENYGKMMEQSLQRKIPLEEAALNWFLCVYTPAVQKIIEEGLEEKFPEKSLADIFAYVMDYKWYKSQKEGHDIGFDRAIKGFVKEITGKESPEEEKERRGLIHRMGGLLEEVLPWLRRE
ncbi:MAG: DUF4032 domain-containing protein [Candidatus Caldatribacteriaceae bacterium]